MAKYLDGEGLATLWLKIKNTFRTEEQVQAAITEAINNLIDGAPGTLDTLKEIADWISDHGEMSNITEAIEERKNKVIAVQTYGFDTNLRINQQIDGSDLVDKVIDETFNKNKQVIIKAGDYYFNVASLLRADGYRGFSVINMDLDPSDINAKGRIQKGVFLYIEALNQTCTFYEREYNNNDIDIAIQAVRDFVETELDNKTDLSVSSATGTSLMFNEADGGGAKFEHTDGSEAFVGVNNGGLSGLMAQIYADKQIDGAWVGSRINVYHDGIYYVSKTAQQNGSNKNDPNCEIATKADIANIEVDIVSLTEEEINNACV